MGPRRTRCGQCQALTTMVFDWIEPGTVRARGIPLCFACFDAKQNEPTIEQLGMFPR